MSLVADDGSEAEVCMSLPPSTSDFGSDFGSGLAFTESELWGDGVLGGGSVAKSPVSKIDSFPSMGCPGTIT